MAEKKFGDRHFRSQPLLATRSWLIKERLARLFARAGLEDRLPAMMAGFGKADGPEAAASNAAAIAAFTSVFDRTPEGEITNLVKDLCEIAEIRQASGGYTPVDFDRDFTGHDGDVLPVVVWIVREQFGDFF